MFFYIYFTLLNHFETVGLGVSLYVLYLQNFKQPNLT